MQISNPQQWEPLSVIPILAGLCWLLPHPGTAWLLWGLLPGVILLGCGVGLLLFPGDPRICAYMAVGAALGVLLFVPAWIAGSFGLAAVALVGSLASFLTAGRAALIREPLYPEVPVPEVGLRMDMKVGLDKFVLGYFVGGARVPGGDDALPMFEEARQMTEAFRARGWDRDPSPMHAAPPAPTQVYIERARFRRYDYELLRFDSGYAPDDELPGAALWKSYTPNNRCYVRMFRHPGPPRPWLLCIHGYRMGVPWLDFGLFDPAWLHERLGLNVLQPILPLHGPRRIGARTGDYYLDGDPLDLVYAQAQALWDLRRLLAWLRATEAPARVGVFGFSLGGYNAALLAAYDGGLDFAATIIPVIDFPTALMRFLPPAHLRFYREHGLDEQRYRDILSVVSPLARPPQLAREHRHIVAGIGDRIVLPDHALALGRHWEVPINWYQGSHLSVRFEPAIGRTLRQAISKAGWAV